MVLIDVVSKHIDEPRVCVWYKKFKNLKNLKQNKILFFTRGGSRNFNMWK